MMTQQSGKRNRFISPLYGEGRRRTRNRKSLVEEREGTARVGEGLEIENLQWKNEKVRRGSAKD